MIRTPTPEKEIYRWYLAALADPSTPRIDGEPQAGFYKQRMVKGGPFCPVEVRLVQEIDPDTGELAAPEVYEAVQLGRKLNVDRVWTFLRPITREEFNELEERHGALGVMSATHAAIDLSKTPILPGGR